MSAKKAKTLDDFESPKRKAATWDDVGLKVSPGFAGLVDVAAQKKPATKRAASTTTAILGLDTPNRNEKTEMEEKLEAKKRKTQEVSLQYEVHRTLSATQKIPNGFQLKSSSTENIDCFTLDKGKSPSLKALLGTVQPLLERFDCLLNMSSALVAHVLHWMCNEQDSLAAQTSESSERAALLFKYLADRVDLTVALNRPSQDSHVATIHTTSQSVAVDFRALIKDKSFPKDLTQHIDSLLSKQNLAGGDQVEWTKVPESGLVVLGSGRFGKVYQIQLGPRQFALKVVDLAQAIEEQRKLVEKEIKIMRYVDCDQVVKLVRHHQANTQIRLILELERTSLDSVIKNVKDAKRPPFALHEVKQVALDVALALKYLHMHVTKIVHRDIKSHNILLKTKEDGTICAAKLGDFGLATRFRFGRGKAEKVVGSRRWMAPEIQAGREYDESVDVWSFGMLLVELVTLSLPYADVSVLDIQSTVSSLQLPRIQVHQNTDAESATKLRAIIDTCLQFDASKRPSAERLVAVVLEL